MLAKKAATKKATKRAGEGQRSRKKKEKTDARDRGLR
jgi:hypothetical protein